MKTRKALPSPTSLTIKILLLAQENLAMAQRSTFYTLENHNSFPVKLLRRFWEIFDSNGEHRVVEGEGVVGVQPLIMPGKQYQYVSGCNLKTELGKMQGYYNMENIENREAIQVKIPAFKMIAPVKLN